MTYAFCDCWFIYARDAKGVLHYVCTELWPEWQDLHPNADQEANAVEKYMLPRAQRQWHSLPWKRAAL